MFKYGKPLDAQRSFTPSEVSLDCVELEITFQCNLKCLHCSRRIPQAPSKESMTLNQIERFAAESNRLWKRITLSGGEPTLHKDLLYIVDILLPTTKKMVLVTNGYGPEVSWILKTLPTGVEIHNSHKENVDPPNFVNVDTTCLESSKGEVDVRACYVPKHCGILLNRHGYYCCVLAGGIDRSLGLGIAINSLSSVNKESLTKQMSVLCQYCGHSRDAPGGAYSDVTKSDETSPFWAEAYKEYLTGHVNIPVY